MWFRNLRIYRLANTASLTTEGLEAALAAQPLRRCGGFDMISRGWVFPAQDGSFVHAVGRHWLLALGVELKLLPATVIRQEAQDRANAIQVQESRTVGKREMRDLRERVAQELLPKAFTRRRTTWAWIDTGSGLLFVDAGSDTRADEFVEVMLRSDDSILLRPLQSQQAATSAMTEWLAAGNAPAGFTIDQDLELKPAAGGQAAIRYARHPVDGMEIAGHLAAGKVATRLGMTWNDRVSFILTDKLQIRRLAFLDIVREVAAATAQAENEQLDIDFALMAGETGRLAADLLVALGGERKSDD